MLSCIFNSVYMTLWVSQNIGMTITEDNMKAVAEFPGCNISVYRRTESHIPPKEVCTLVSERSNDKVPHVLHLNRDLFIIYSLAETGLLKGKKMIYCQTYLKWDQLYIKQKKIPVPKNILIYGLYYLKPKFGRNKKKIKILNSKSDVFDQKHSNIWHLLCKTKVWEIFFFILNSNSDVFDHHIHFHKP